MRIDAVIRETLEAELGTPVGSIMPVAGGDINDAFRVDLAERAVFVKTRPEAPPGAFRDEAAGLRWLAEPSGLPTPGIVLAHEAFLALDWVDRGSLDAVGEEALGRGLAQTHLAGALSFGATPVLEADGSLATETGHAPMEMGAITLPNDPADTFAAFYAERRILPLAERARAMGRLSPDHHGLMHRLAERLPELVGPPEPPARIHGDLWAGNVLAGIEGQPWLIDPVAHGGHRELDLAALRVFGGPGERCFDAYAEVAPLTDGHADRIPLMQLGIILLHVALFGGAYEAQAAAIARRYV